MSEESESTEEEVTKHVCEWSAQVNCGNWLCPNKTCFCSFYIAEAFIDHIETCDSNDSIYSNAVVNSSGVPCCLCGAVIPLMRFQQHIEKSHKKIHQMLCSIHEGDSGQCLNYKCCKRFHDGIAYLKHQASCKPLYCCQSCQQEFSSDVRLQRHVNICKSNASTTDSTLDTPSVSKRVTGEATISTATPYRKSMELLDASKKYTGRRRSARKSNDLTLNDLDEDAPGNSKDSLDSCSEQTMALRRTSSDSGSDFEDELRDMKPLYLPTRKSSTSTNATARKNATELSAKGKAHFSMKKLTGKEVLGMETRAKPLSDIEKEEYLTSWFEEVGSGIWCCPNTTCKQRFYIPYRFAKHIVQCSAAVRVTTDVLKRGTLPCAFCKNNIFIENFNKHTRTKHRETLKNLRQLRIQGQITCPNYMCSAVFEDGASFIQHSTTCFPFYRCEKCNKEYISRCGMKKHACVLKTPKAARQSPIVPRNVIEHQVLSPIPKSAGCTSMTRTSATSTSAISTPATSTPATSTPATSTLATSTPATSTCQRAVQRTSTPASEIPSTTDCKALHSNTSQEGSEDTESASRPVDEVESGSTDEPNAKEIKAVLYENIKQGIFHCPSPGCLEEFFVPHEFARHLKLCCLRKHPTMSKTVDQLPCPYCNTTPPLDIYGKHFRERHITETENIRSLRRGKEIPCPNYKCNELFTDGRKYLQHSIVCKPLYHCEGCNSDFKTKKYIGTHKCVTKHRKSLGMASKLKELVCPKTGCGQLFTSIDEYQRHSGSCQPQSPCDTLDATQTVNDCKSLGKIEQEYLVNWKNEIKNGVFRCPNGSCQEDFFLPKVFIKHLEHCDADEPYCNLVAASNSLPCAFCDRECNMVNFLGHNKDWHREIYTRLGSLAKFETVVCCNFKCKEKFTDGKLYLKHAVGCQPLFQCEECLREFKSSKSLGKHKCKRVSKKAKKNDRAQSSTGKKGQRVSLKSDSTFSEGCADKTVEGFGVKFEDAFQEETRKWKEKVGHGVLECPFKGCRKSFVFPQVLVRHIRACDKKGVHMGTITKGVLPCMVCEKEVAFVRFGRHFQTNHKQVYTMLEKLQKGVPLLCPNYTCHKKFKSPKGFLAHVSSCTRIQQDYQGHQDAHEGEMESEDGHHTQSPDTSQRPSSGGDSRLSSKRTGTPSKRTLCRNVRKGKNATKQKDTPNVKSAGKAKKIRPRRADIASDTDKEENLLSSRMKGMQPGKVKDAKISGWSLRVALKRSLESKEDLMSAVSFPSPKRSSRSARTKSQCASELTSLKDGDERKLKKSRICSSLQSDNSPGINTAPDDSDDKDMETSSIADGHTSDIATLAEETEDSIPQETVYYSQLIDTEEGLERNCGNENDRLSEAFEKNHSPPVLEMVQSRSLRKRKDSKAICEISIEKDVDGSHRTVGSPNIPKQSETRYKRGSTPSLNRAKRKCTSDSAVDYVKESLQVSFLTEEDAVKSGKGEDAVKSGKGEDAARSVKGEDAAPKRQTRSNIKSASRSIVGESNIGKKSPRLQQQLEKCSMEGEPAEVATVPKTDSKGGECRKTRSRSNTTVSGTSDDGTNGESCKTRSSGKKKFGTSEPSVPSKGRSRRSKTTNRVTGLISKSPLNTAEVDTVPKMSSDMPSSKESEGEGVVAGMMGTKAVDKSQTEGEDADCRKRDVDAHGPESQESGSPRPARSQSGTSDDCTNRESCRTRSSGKETFGMSEQSVPSKGRSRRSTTTNGVTGLTSKLPLNIAGGDTVPKMSGNVPSSKESEGEGVVAGVKGTKAVDKGQMEDEDADCKKKDVDVHGSESQESGSPRWRRSQRHTHAHKETEIHSIDNDETDTVNIAVDNFRVLEGNVERLDGILVSEHAETDTRDEETGVDEGHICIGNSYHKVSSSNHTDSVEALVDSDGIIEGGCDEISVKDSNRNGREIGGNVSEVHRQDRCRVRRSQRIVREPVEKVVNNGKNGNLDHVNDEDSSGVPRSRGSNEFSRSGGKDAREGKDSRDSSSQDFGVQDQRDARTEISQPLKCKLIVLGKGHDKEGEKPKEWSTEQGRKGKTEGCKESDKSNKVILHEERLTGNDAVESRNCERNSSHESIDSEMEIEEEDNIQKILGNGDTSVVSTALSAEGGHLVSCESSDSTETKKSNTGRKAERKRKATPSLLYVEEKSLVHSENGDRQENVPAQVENMCIVAKETSEQSLASSGKSSDLTNTTAKENVMTDEKAECSETTVNIKPKRAEKRQKSNSSNPFVNEDTSTEGKRPRKGQKNIPSNVVVVEESLAEGKETKDTLEEPKPMQSSREEKSNASDPLVVMKASKTTRERKDTLHVSSLKQLENAVDSNSDLVSSTLNKDVVTSNNLPNDFANTPTEHSRLINEKGESPIGTEKMREKRTKREEKSKPPDRVVVESSTAENEAKDTLKESSLTQEENPPDINVDSLSTNENEGLATANNLSNNFTKTTPSEFCEADKTVENSAGTVKSRGKRTQKGQKTKVSNPVIVEGSLAAGHETKETLKESSLTQEENPADINVDSLSTNENECLATANKFSNDYTNTQSNQCCETDETVENSTGTVKSRRKRTKRGQKSKLSNPAKVEESSTPGNETKDTLKESLLTQEENPPDSNVDSLPTNKNEGLATVNNLSSNFTNTQSNQRCKTDETVENSTGTVKSRGKRTQKGQTSKVLNPVVVEESLAAGNETKDTLKESSLTQEENLADIDVDSLSISVNEVLATANNLSNDFTNTQSNQCCETDITVETGKMRGKRTKGGQKSKLSDRAVVEEPSEAGKETQYTLPVSSLPQSEDLLDINVDSVFAKQTKGITTSINLLEANVFASTPSERSSIADKNLESPRATVKMTRECRKSGQMSTVSHPIELVESSPAGNATEHILEDSSLIQSYGPTGNILHLETTNLNEDIRPASNLLNDSTNMPTEQSSMADERLGNPKGPVKMARKCTKRGLKSNVSAPVVVEESSSVEKEKDSLHESSLINSESSVDKNFDAVTTHHKVGIASVIEIPRTNITETLEEDDAVPVERKRKRGRPPKIDKGSESSKVVVVEESSSVEKEKESLHESSLINSESSVDKNLDAVTTHHKVEIASAIEIPRANNSETLEDDDAVPVEWKRKRGRPRKTSKVSIDKGSESSKVDTSVGFKTDDLVLKDSTLDSTIAVDVGAADDEKQKKRKPPKKRGRKGKKKQLQKYRTISFKPEEVLEQFEGSSEIQRQYKNWLDDTRNANLHCPNEICPERFQTSTRMFLHIRKCTVGNVNKVVLAKDKMPCLACQEMLDMKTYQTHLRSLHTSVFRLIRHLENGLIPSCENEQCQGMINNTVEAVEHGIKCGFYQTCPLCHRVFKRMKQIESHCCKLCKFNLVRLVVKFENGRFSLVQESIERDSSKRQLTSKRKSFVGMDEEEDNDNDDDEVEDFKATKSESDSDDFPNEEDIPDTSRPRALQQNFIPHAFPYKTDTYTKCDVVKPVPDNIPFYQSWLKLHHSDVLFQQYIPSLSMIELVEQRDHQKYLPSSNCSALFNIVYDSQKRHLITSDDFQLSLFEAMPPLPGSTSQTIYCGGPVWAMDWCPCPGYAEQYLAVSTHKSHTDLYLQHTFDDCDGLLQIWNMGKIDNRRNVVSPRMALGIAHSFGPVYSLAWCPSGTWQEQSKDNNSNQLDRLGLLAVGCGDSCIRILSVPYPDQIRRNYKIDDAAPVIVKISPHLILAPKELNARKRESAKVMDFQWLPTKGHGKIAAGFGDGTVCVWKIDAISRLLTDSSDDALTKTVLPITIVPMHECAVRSIAWCPADTNFLLSGSMDRTVKVTDLRNPLFSVIVIRRGYLHSVAFGVHKTSFFTVEDTLFSYCPSGARYYDLIVNAQKDLQLLSTIIATRHKRGVRALAVSEWYDTITTGCDGGLVIMRPCYGLSHCRKTTTPVYRLTRHFLSEKNNPQGDFAHDNKSGDDQTSTREKDRTTAFVLEMAANERTESLEHIKEYINASVRLMKKSRYTFRDLNFLEFRIRPECCIHEIENPRDYQEDEDPRLPMTLAINRVCWNPNVGTQMWLATGTQLGLVRLHPMWSWNSNTS